MTAKYDAIIFDIDGTLWNACQASARGWNTALARLGISKEVTARQIQSVAGNPFDKCVELLLPGLQKQYPQLLAALDEYEIEVVKSEGGLFYDGVIEGIRKLALSHRIFLVSNCQDWYLKLFLQFSGFEDILSGFDCHGRSGLPKHEMLSGIIKQFGLKKTVYIGDTQLDESSAKHAEMDFIHVAYGFGNPVGKVLSFNSFSDLVDHLM